MWSPVLLVCLVGFLAELLCLMELMSPNDTSYKSDSLISFNCSEVWELGCLTGLVFGCYISDKLISLRDFDEVLLLGSEFEFLGYLYCCLFAFNYFFD
jgi:hypothetical protein